MTLIVVAAGLLKLLQPDEPSVVVPLILLSAVLVGAARTGVWPGIAAALVAFATYNFLFVEPRFTLRVANLEDMVTLAVFLVLAGLTGWLAGRLHDEAESATRRALHLRHLAGLIASLARAETGVAAIGALASEVNLLTGRRAFVLRLRGQTPEPAVAVPAGSVLEDEYLPQAARAFTYGSAQPPATYGRSGRPIAFYPFGETGESRHVLAADFPDGTGTGVDELDRTIGLMGAQTEEALARIARIDEVNAARLQVQTETLRSGLLLSLSHDLRTPLSGILGAVSSLREPSLDLTPDVRRDLLQAAEEETRRLARYVDDLLTLTRLQTGMKPALMPADAGDIVSVAVSRARAAHSTCTILIAQSGTAYPLLTDDALLGQALFNLIDNAVKHGGANQPVTVTLFYDEDAFAVQVADKGAGIPEEARSRIFDPLFRGGDSHGTGLGLAIVRSAVTVLGGSVELVQQPHGATGTAFLIRLPKSGGGS